MLRLVRWGLVSHNTLRLLLSYHRGTLGWAIEQGHITPQHYRYIVLVNASVRGPFLPAYWPLDLHWSTALTARLTAEVKMVGPTINCEAYQASDGNGWATNPHVQTYALALDNVWQPISGLS